MSRYFYHLFYTGTFQTLMKRILFFIFLMGLSAQVRVGDMRSITSSLNVRALASNGKAIFLATGGGLVHYAVQSDGYKVYTKDHGLVDTEIQTIHVGPKGLVWLGSNLGVQVWDSENEAIHGWFQLGIERVTGFASYEDMVYAAVKNDGGWGIMEFMHKNEKVYYRDFYQRTDIKNISEIASFHDRLYLITDLGLIAGNPHLEHPLYWTDPFPNMNEGVLALNTTEGIMALVTDKAIYSIQKGYDPVAIIRQDANIKTIQHVAIQNAQLFYAISDSVIFEIATDKLLARFTNLKMRFTDIYASPTDIWIGNQIGFGQLTGNSFDHKAINDPLVQSPQAIGFIGKDQWIIASDKGLSLSGWYNWSTTSIPESYDTELIISRSPIDLGSGITEIILQKNTVLVGLKNSLSAGLAKIDITDGLNLEQLYFPRESTNGSEYVYTLAGAAVDNKGSYWTISKNEYNVPISVFYDEQTRHISITESGGKLSNDFKNITIDNFNRIWVGSPSGLVMYEYTGDVMNPEKEVWLEEAVNPGLPKRNPLAINVSEKNRLWILTPVGLIYKELQVSDIDPVNKTGPLGNNNELYPYFPNGSFNYNSKIRFDPRGNVWITTHSDGILVISENGEYWPDINGLNIGNSNLLSNQVNDVAFDAENGLAFVATSKGVSVLRTPFADQKETYSSIEIFPSPFRIPDTQPMTITGLKDNSTVIIMTLNGRVVIKINYSEINGYQAFWDGRNKSGQLVDSGIYLIAIHDDKGASSIEKVAVVRK